MFEKILIANRGEIALRVLRACKELGIRPWPCIQPPMPTRCTCGSPTRAYASARRRRGKCYLNVPALLAACEITGADAVHPGYGFLSENARFAEILAEHSIHFIGPRPSTSA